MDAKKSVKIMIAIVVGAAGAILDAISNLIEYVRHKKRRHK
jgi:hypothetical protein